MQVTYKVKHGGVTTTFESMTRARTGTAALTEENILGYDIVNCLYLETPVAPERRRALLRGALF